VSSSSSNSSSKSSSASSSSTPRDESITPTSRGSFLTGSCGWSDESLARCARFYPASCKSSLQRLTHYSRFFPCVEVDTSTYAIPSKDQAKSWCDATPVGFVFHIKAFGLLASKSCPMNAIPRDIREEFVLAASLQKEDPTSTVFLSQLEPSCISSIWERFNTFVDVFYKAKKLASVVFQFQTSLEPSISSSIDYVAECRSRLYKEFPMSVEFRSRSWYSLKPPTSILRLKIKKNETKGEGDGEGRDEDKEERKSFKTQLEATLDALSTLGIINILSDDLGCEFGASEAPQPTMPDGRLLVADYLTSSQMGILRLHRRKGDKRILGSAVLRELSCRVHRIAASAGGEADYKSSIFQELEIEKFTDDLIKKSYTSISSRHSPPPCKVTGPIYFLCGTDFEDQPIINMRALSNSVELFKKGTEGSTTVLHSAFSFDWVKFVKQKEAGKGILKFFSPITKTTITGVKRERESEEG
jgi:uncharacterized protein YecE (DUF72 family)